MIGNDTHHSQIVDQFELMNRFDELFEYGRRGGGPASAKEDEDDKPASFGRGRNEPGAV